MRRAKESDDRALEPLIAALKSRNDRVCGYAANALGVLGDTRAVEPLIAALKNENEEGRRYAAEALGNLGDARAVELPQLLKMKKNYWVRQHVTAPEVFGLCRPSLNPHSRFENIAQGSYEGRCAAEALGNLGDARAVEPPSLAALKMKIMWCAGVLPKPWSSWAMPAP